MKRILIYGLTAKLGGLENFIINHLRLMKLEGLEIHLLVHEPPIFEEELKERGFLIHEVPRRGESFFANIRETKKLFANYHFDTIWMHVCTLSTIEAIKQAWKAQVSQRIIHVHCPQASGGWKMESFHRLHKKSIGKYANRYWACSQGAADFSFSEEMQRSSNFALVHNAIDLDRFAYNPVKRAKIRKELGIGNEFVLGHVGHLVDVKNHDYLIDIFKSYQKRDSKAKLILVGKGNLEEEIREKVLRYGLKDNVYFVGSKTNVADYYSAFDVLVFPSKYEGLPLSLVEAQASGLPCLISENIDSVVALTPLVQFASIEADPNCWADSLCLIEKEGERVSYDNLLREAGFDLRLNVEKIRQVLLEEEGTD